MSSHRMPYCILDHSASLLLWGQKLCPLLCAVPCGQPPSSPWIGGITAPYDQAWGWHKVELRCSSLFDVIACPPMLRCRLSSQQQLCSTTQVAFRQASVWTGIHRGPSCHGYLLSGCLSANDKDSSLLSLQPSALWDTHSVISTAGHLLETQVPTVLLKHDEPRENLSLNNHVPTVEG